MRRILLLLLSSLLALQWPYSANAQCRTSNKYIGTIDALDSAGVLQLIEWIGSSAYHASYYSLQDGRFLGSKMMNQTEANRASESGGQWQYTWVEDGYGNTTTAHVKEGDKFLLSAKFDKGILEISYDFPHQRGLVGWRNAKGAAKLFLIQPNADNKEIVATKRVTFADFGFSADGRYATNSEGFLIDMNEGRLLAKNLYDKDVRQWGVWHGTSKFRKGAARSIRFNADGTQVAIPYCPNPQTTGLRVFNLPEGTLQAEYPLPPNIKAEDGNTWIACPDMKGYFFLMRTICDVCPMRRDAWIIRDGKAQVLCNEGFDAHGAAIAKAKSEQSDKDLDYWLYKQKKAEEEKRNPPKVASQSKREPRYQSCGYCGGSGQMKVQKQTHSNIGGVGTIGRTGHVSWERAPSSVTHTSTEYKACPGCNGTGKVAY